LCLEFSPLQVPSLQRQAWSAVTTRGRAEAVLHTAFQALLPGLDVGEARRVLAEHGCVGSKFTSGVVPKVFPPCRNHSRQRGCQRRRLAKEIRSVPDASTVQAHNRARRTHLPRILIQPVLPSRLSCSKTQARFGSPFDLQSAAAQLAQLPRACWKLESRVTTARKLPRACKFESRITTARRPWRFVRVGKVQL